MCLCGKTIQQQQYNRYHITIVSILLIHPPHLNPPAPVCFNKTKFLVPQISWEWLHQNNNNTHQKQKKTRGITFPRSPLCLDRRLPPFFTATSSVLLWSSTVETLNSNLQTHTGTYIKYIYNTRETSLKRNCDVRWLQVI